MDRGEISITGTELIVGEVKAQSMLAGQLTACKVNSVILSAAKNECHGFMTVTGPLQLTLTSFQTSSELCSKEISGNLYIHRDILV